MMRSAACLRNTRLPLARYTGKERDTESGLDYFGARYYGSGTGRWMSPDWDSEPFPVPYAGLEDPQTLNLYSYVQNNPFSSRDRDGHASWQDNGNGQNSWQGDYNGERDCSGSGGCLFWNQGSGEWQNNDPTPPPLPSNDVTGAGGFITGFGRMLSAHSFADFSYGLREAIPGNNVVPRNSGTVIAGTIRAKLPNVSGKAGAKDIPSWAQGSGPNGAESGKDYAKRMMNEKYGEGGWSTSSQEYSQIKKYGDRSFVAPEAPAPVEPEIPIVE